MSTGQKLLYWYYRFKLEGRLGKVFWWFLVFCFFLLLGYNLNASYDYRIERTQAHAKISSMMIKQLATRGLDRLDDLNHHISRVLEFENFNYSKTSLSPIVHAMLEKELISHKAATVGIAIYDISGNIVDHVGASMHDLSADASYKILKNDGKLIKMETSPFRMADSRVLIGTVRKISKNDEIIGFVMSTTDLNAFDKMFKELNTGPGDIYQVRSARNNALIVRYPADDSLVGKEFPYSDFDKRIFFGEKSGVDTYTTVRDDKTKIVSFHKLNDYDIVAIAMIDPRPFFQSYYKELFFSALLMALALFFIFT